MVEMEEFFKGQVGQILQVIIFICLSFVAFRALQFAVRWYLFGKCTFRTFSYFEFVRKRRRQSKRVPDSQSLQVVPPNKKWRISNEFVSLIHSVISGVWALYAILMFPDLVNHMNDFVDKVPLGLIYLSFGYLLHDLIDLLINERSFRILELLFHHVIVITAFLTTLLSGMFLGVVIFGLLMELNSVFLHTRSLMNLYGQPKNSTSFKVVALLNIATFMVFRMAVSAYLLYWQFTNALVMKWYLVVVTFVVIVSLAITNSILLYRVLAADGLLGKKHIREPRNVAVITSSSLTTAAQPTDETEEDQDDDEIDSFSDYENDECTDDVENGGVPSRRRKQKRTDKLIKRRESIEAATQTTVEVDEATQTQLGLNSDEPTEVGITSNGKATAMIINYSTEDNNTTTEGTSGRPIVNA